MNMNVINKNNGKDYNVYDITYDKAGYPHFLIYKDGQWLRMSAKYFRPAEYVFSCDLGDTETFAEHYGCLPTNLADLGLSETNFEVEIDR